MNIIHERELVALYGVPKKYAESCSSSLEEYVIHLGCVHFGEIILFFETAKQYDLESMQFHEYLAEDERLAQDISPIEYDLFMGATFKQLDIGIASIAEVMIEMTSEIWSKFSWPNQVTIQDDIMREIVKSAAYRKYDDCDIRWDSFKSIVSRLFESLDN